MGKNRNSWMSQLTNEASVVALCCRFFMIPQLQATENFMNAFFNDIRSDKTPIWFES